MVKENPFRSFWMGGFECADHLNAFGNRVDLLAATGHLERLHEDFGGLLSFGIKTVREGIRWSRVEQIPERYDFSDVKRIQTVAQEMGVQVIWDLCHFGYPADLTPLHPMFARRFANLCRAFTLFFREHWPDETLIVTPINEVSFISWLGGEVCGASPYCHGYGWHVKYALMRAYVEGIVAIKEIDPEVRIMPTEPLVNIAPKNPLNGFAVVRSALKNEEQFQVLDILAGRQCPELGGQEEYLDIIGLNFYHNNQWHVETEETIPWAEDHPCWRALDELVDAVYGRYHRPMVLSETSHTEDNRPQWLCHVTEECSRIIERGLPLWGVCIYPVIDRPDWDYPDRWHHSGIWDIHDPVGLERHLSPAVAEVLEDCINNKLAETLITS